MEVIRLDGDSAPAAVVCDVSTGHLGNLEPTLLAYLASPMDGPPMVINQTVSCESYVAPEGFVMS